MVAASHITDSRPSGSIGCPADPVEDAIFLVGAERSGTTLLRIMLNGHPAIVWSNQFEYAVDRMTDAGPFPDTHAYARWLSTHRIFRNTALEVDASLDYPAIVRSFLAQRIKRSGKRVVGATCHRHFDRLLRIWPKARFIHILRDPRDVARSNIKMGWAGNVYFGVRLWIEVERLWERVAQQVGPERYVEVTHEALIDDPPRELTRICSFLGLGYDPAMLDYGDRSSYDKPDKSLVQQWRRKLSEFEVRLVEARVGDMLTKRGYEPSGLPPLDITPGLKARLTVQNRLACINHRRTKYGLPLWMSDLASRRIGTTAWRDRVQLRLNDIDNQHLQ